MPPHPSTLHDLSDGEVALLGGNGHFRYHGIACQIFLRDSELNPHFKKITTGESGLSPLRFPVQNTLKILKVKVLGENNLYSSGSMWQDTAVWTSKKT